MDQDGGRPCMDSLSYDTSYSRRREESRADVTTDDETSDDSCSIPDERNGRDASTLDVSEVLRRWTNALQRIHKQALCLVLI